MQEKVRLWEISNQVMIQDLTSTSLVLGWDEFESEAKRLWGNGKYHLHTNMDQYRNEPANLCSYDKAIVTFESLSDPKDRYSTCLLT